MVNKNNSKKITSLSLLCCTILLVCATGVAAQEQSLTLEQCYKLAEANYPLTKQRGLIQETKNFNVDNIEKGIYPQFDVSGTGTYQSAVTTISIPGFNLNLPSIPKAQYKMYGEVSQTLTGFNINKQSRGISKANADVEEQNLETQIYALKDRINQVFFGILMIDGQLEQNELSKNDIQAGINKVQGAIANGTDFRSSLDKLKAQLLQTDQHSVDLRASRKAYTDMLGLFINQQVTDQTVLVKPEAPLLTDSIARPELKAYDFQIRAYQLQERLTKINNYPQLGVFFQGGFGQPSPLNFLNPNVAGYYITGLRLSWNIGGLYTLKRDLQINRNNQLMTETQRSNFLFNTGITLKQQNADVVRYQKLMESDNEIIRLRQSVKIASQAQLENGVITANDYLLDIDAESGARENKVVHEIQWLMSLYAVKTTTGIQ